MKRILSLILALTVLLGCSLMVFAAEPCEYCEDGEIHAFGWSSTGLHDSAECPSCFEQEAYRVEKQEYICDGCGEIGYTQYRRVYACGYKQSVSDFS